MKVLQILYSGLGGHGSVVTSLIDADTVNKWKHSLLFYGIEDLLFDYQQFCKSRNIPFSFIKKTKGLLKTENAKINTALRKHDPDIILVHSPNLIFTIWWYCIQRKKIFFVIEHTPNDIKGLTELLASFFSLILARKVIYLSVIYQKQISRKFWFIPVKKRSVLINNGIDLQRFKVKDKTVNDREIHGGMIGRFTHQKNQKLIVEALEKGIHLGSFHSRIVIHFAGNGDLLVELKELVIAKNLQDFVHFHGLLSEKEIIEFFGKLDFYVHSSYAETMCTSVMQAMACGLPILASNISGINDIVEEGENALLFDNNDVDSLVKKLSEMQELKLRNRLSYGSRQYAVENFLSLQTFNKYCALIERVK